MSDNEVERTIGSDGALYRVLLEVDADAGDLNPRDNEYNVGTMVCCLDTYGRYRVPAEGDLVHHIRDAIEGHTFPVVARWLRIFHGATTVLPLGYRGFPAGSPDDMANVNDFFGVIYDSEESRAHLGVPEAVDVELALAEEAETYGQWAEGEVFGHVIERATSHESPEWEEVGDSCFGYIGHDYAKQQAKAALADWLDSAQHSE